MQNKRSRRRLMSRCALNTALIVGLHGWGWSRLAAVSRCPAQGLLVD
jgi:hypothetical protein